MLKEEISSTLSPTIGLWIGQPKLLANTEPARIVGVFPKDETWTLYLLGFINSSICTDLINAINPSTNNSANYIKKIPFLKPDNGTRKKIECLVKEIITSIEKGDDVTSIKIELDDLFSKMYVDRIGMESKSTPNHSIKQLNLFNVLQQYPENIVNNAPIIKPAKKQESDYL